MVVFAEPMLNAGHQRLAALTTRHRRPRVYKNRVKVNAGSLISHGTNVNQMFLVAAEYTARILIGAEPADLPVVQPACLEPVVNTKAAKGTVAED